MFWPTQIDFMGDLLGWTYLIYYCIWLYLTTYIALPFVLKDGRCWGKYYNLTRYDQILILVEKMTSRVILSIENGLALFFWCHSKTLKVNFFTSISSNAIYFQNEECIWFLSKWYNLIYFCKYWIHLMDLPHVSYLKNEHLKIYK